ncbi:hypothetical protein RKE29_08655 [Streptomyces sp. B1866]|uniref:hypothetical protein n=1 Tax=Streptomyces sp. B1866 TaxID=3075431 RepID=UPI002892883F|nr:hypothetical protein [Streptomyces sp. B1866]MDT3396708.1 hypothetical protein [Streptomyces sp. B1866]
MARALLLRRDLKDRKQEQEGVPWRISDSGTTREERLNEKVIAYPERQLPPGGGVKEYKAARKSGARAFTLWADPDRRQVYAHVTTEQTAKDGAVYQVVSPAGEPLAVVTRRPALRGGGVRARWTVQPVGQPPAVGYKGRIGWWCAWWLLSPVWFAVAALCIVGALLGGGDGDVPRMPRRVVWRAGGRQVLDARSASGGYRLQVPDDSGWDWWDPRVTAAVVALLNSHAGLLGLNWDADRD